MREKMSCLIAHCCHGYKPLLLLSAMISSNSSSVICPSAVEYIGRDIRQFQLHIKPHRAYRRLYTNVNFNLFPSIRCLHFSYTFHSYCGTSSYSRISTSRTHAFVVFFKVYRSLQGLQESARFYSRFFGFTQLEHIAKFLQQNF